MSFRLTFLNKGDELTFQLVMLIQVYFIHAELWHRKPFIHYKCINMNIRVPTSVHTRRGTAPVISVYCKHNEV